MTERIRHVVVRELLCSAFLPGWMQFIGKALPLYYGADALRKVIILNASLAAIMPDVIILVVYTLFTMAIAIPLFEKAMTR